MRVSTSWWVVSWLSTLNTWKRPGSRSCHAIDCTFRQRPLSTRRWWRREVTPPASASESTASACVSGCDAAGVRHDTTTQPTSAARRTTKRSSPSCAGSRVNGDGIGAGDGGSPP